MSSSKRKKEMHVTSIRIELAVHRRLHVLKTLTKKDNMSQLLDEMIQKVYPNIDQIVSDYEETEQAMDKVREKLLGNNL